MDIAGSFMRTNTDINGYLSYSSLTVRLYLKKVKKKPQEILNNRGFAPNPGGVDPNRREAFAAAAKKIALSPPQRLTSLALPVYQPLHVLLPDYSSHVNAVGRKP
jgi:hypothetical protein